MRSRAGQVVERSRYQLYVAAVAAGLALAPAPRLAVGLAAAVLVTGATLGHPRLAGACCLLLVASVLVGGLRLSAIDAPGKRLASWARIDERAVLLERPRLAGTRSYAALRLASGPGRGAKLLAAVEGEWPGPTDPGAELRVVGLVKPPVRGAGSDFDWPAHLRRRGISYELELARLVATGARRGGLAGALDAARRRAERAIEAGLPADKAALARGMVLGQDERIDPLTRDDWRDSGLAHLLSYTA